MKRWHLFEWGDLPWWPQIFRDDLTEYLQVLSNEVKPYRGVVPRLAAAIHRSGARNVIDLCSGAGSSWVYLLPLLIEKGCQTSVVVTDKFPNLTAFSRLTAMFPDIRSESSSVEAQRVPHNLDGFRTLFTAFHHFTPESAEEILRAAVVDQQGIGVFEVTTRSWKALLRFWLTLLSVWLITPFVRPFRWSRLLWTYVIPVLPVAIAFDGMVSCLRTYTAEELHEMVAKVDAENDYDWEIGVDAVPETNLLITYLIGVPSV